MKASTTLFNVSSGVVVSTSLWLAIAMRSGVIQSPSAKYFNSKPHLVINAYTSPRKGYFTWETLRYPDMALVLNMSTHSKTTYILEFSAVEYQQM